MRFWGWDRDGDGNGWMLRRRGEIMENNISLGEMDGEGDFDIGEPWTCRRQMRRRGCILGGDVFMACSYFD